MDNLFLPKSIDNHYHGKKLALWLFWVVVLTRALQGASLLINGRSIVKEADGIPLETFSAAASQSILGMFAISAGSRIVLSLLGILIFVKYRSAIPLMFAVLALDQGLKEILLLFYPLYRTGNPVGPIINLVLLFLTIIGLVFSLWNKRGITADETLT
jgi:hypothetical protein